MEEHNTFDKFPVAVMKNSDVVGHVPLETLLVFSSKKTQQHHLSNNRQEKTLNCTRKRTSGSMHLYIQRQN